MRRRVLSERAQAAVSDLMCTLAAYDTWGAPSLEARGRLQARRLGAASQGVERLVIPHFSAVAEEFTRAALLEASEPHVPLTHAITKLLWEGAERQTEQ